MKYIDKYIKNEIKSDEKMIWEWILIISLIIGVLWIVIFYFSLSFWIGYTSTAIILLSYFKINIELVHSKNDWKKFLIDLKKEANKKEGVV